MNVARLPVVQKQWATGNKLYIHGLVYKLSDGILKDLGITLSKLEHVPSEFRVFEDEV